METKFQVHVLLSKFYASSTKNKERKEIELELEFQGENFIQHISDLADIIVASQIPADNPLKLQAAGYLQGYVKRSLKNRVIENSEVQYAVETLIKIMLMKSVSNSVKVQLVLALDSALNIDVQRKEYGMKLVSTFAIKCAETLQHLSQPSQDQEQCEINGLFMIVSALFKQSQDGPLIMEMFKAMSQNLSTLVSTILIQVLQQLLDRASGTNSFAQQQRSEYPQLETLNIEEKLTIVKTWSSIHLEMLKKFKLLKFQSGLKLLAGSPEYARLFSSILKFFVPPQSQQSLLLQSSTQGLLFETEGTLITLCGINQVDLVVNEIKEKVLKSLRIIWTYLLKKKPKDLYSQGNQYIISAQSYAVIIMNTLVFLGQLREPSPYTIESLTMNGNINGIVKTGIDVLCLFSNEIDFQSFFILNSFKLYMQIIIPFFKISDKEREDIESDPKEFVNYQIDICQKQKSGTYKTQAAKLLESVIDHVDGMLTFCVNLNVEIIQHILTGEITTSTYIKDILQKFNLHFKSDEELLDVCLLSLTVMSYALVKRLDLLQMLDHMVVQHLAKFIDEKQSVLIKSRFCLFLSFYLDQLLSTTQRTVQEEYFEKILFFLISSLKSDKAHKIVSLQALDALTTQVNDSLMTLKIQQNFDWIIQTLASYNVDLNLKSYFDFLGDFIKTHYNNFTQDNLVIFMRSLVQRIQNELQSQAVKMEQATTKKKTLNVKAQKITDNAPTISPKANLRINKCWNTIRFIAEHDYFAERYLTIVEETLLPLFEYLVTPNLIDFDDDIIFCLQSLIKKSKNASPVLRKIFPFLPKFQIKYKGIFGNLLQTINYYIVYAKDFFEESKENLSLIYEMSNLSMFRKDKPIILGNNAEGAILLQIAFQNLDGPLMKQAIGDILTNVLARLKDLPMSPTFQRVLHEVFYSAMLLDVNLTLEFLTHSGYLEEFFSQSFKNWKNLRLSYERKLFALAMTNFLFNCNSMPQVLQQKAGFFIRELVSLLTRQQRLDQKMAALSSKKKQATNPLIDQILLEDTYEDSADDENEEEKKQESVPTQIFNITKEGDATADMEVQQDIAEEDKLVADSDFKQDEYDLQFNVTEMVTRINDIDEFEYFSNNFRKALASQPEQMQSLIANHFSLKHRDYLKTILASKRVKLMSTGKAQVMKQDGSEAMVQEEERKHNGKLAEDVNDMSTSSGGAQSWVPRKIIKAKRRGGQQEGDTNNANLMEQQFKNAIQGNNQEDAQM